MINYLIWLNREDTKLVSSSLTGDSVLSEDNLLEAIHGIILYNAKILAKLVLSVPELLFFEKFMQTFGDLDLEIIEGYFEEAVAPVRSYSSLEYTRILVNLGQTLHEAGQNARMWAVRALSDIRRGHADWALSDLKTAVERIFNPVTQRALAFLDTTTTNDPKETYGPVFLDILNLPIKSELYASSVSDRRSLLERLIVKNRSIKGLSNDAIPGTHAPLGAPGPSYIGSKVILPSDRSGRRFYFKALAERLEVHGLLMKVSRDGLTGRGG
jgi:hypothetical protein